MLAARITAALIFVMVQGSGAMAPGAACWDERLSHEGKNSSCVDSDSVQPFLVFGHGKALHRMDLDGRNHRRVLAGVGSAILFDFHYRKEEIYWANKNTGVIYKTSVMGANKQKLSSDKHISGLAVDWIGNGLYWTSQEKGKIKKMDLNGKNEKTLLRHLIQPSSIALEPISRILFWQSVGTTPCIQRSDINGRTITTLIKITKKIKALSVDRQDKRLFWIQLGLQGECAIVSCDYNGNSVHIIDQALRSQTLGISVFLENVYYTDASSKVIKEVNKYTGGRTVDVNKKQMAKPPVGVKVVHALNQPLEDSNSAFTGCDPQGGNCLSICSNSAEPGLCQCAEGFALSKEGTHCEDVNECAHWNHGCSLGCENIPGSYFCTCPKGYALLPDRKTCGEITQCKGNVTKCGHGCLTTDKEQICVCPEGSVLQSNGQACTGCSSPDMGGCSQLCILISPSRWKCGCQPGYQLHQDGKGCIATGPAPYLLVANKEDIRTINPDGTDGIILVEEPRASVTALDYDPVQNNVYFTSISQKTIERININGGYREIVVSEDLNSPEGLAVDWINRRIYWTDTGRASVDSITLAGLNREVIVSKGLEKPKAITVHPLAKKLFWIDIGVHPVVETASLEGTARTIIASTDLVLPSGLTIDFTEDRLFWCDQQRGVVETAALDGSDRRMLPENQVGRPFDLAVFEDQLWISDQKNQALRSIHKRTGKGLQTIHSKMFQPASIVVVHPLAKPGTDVCLHHNGGCTQVCESKLGFAHCSCLPSYILSADGKTCRPADSSNITGNMLSVFTEKMVSDQSVCSSLRCGVNAQCLLQANSPTCLCVEGFTGDGQLCMDIDECKLGTHNCNRNTECQNTLGKFFCKCQAGHNSNEQTCQDPETTLSVTTGRPADVTFQHHNSNSAESCPSTHESYCLYQGVCFYFPEMDTYACNCLPGYVGERCQFSDPEWWELQQTEEEKKRNVVIAACMVGLISLLSITACVTYCYGTKKFCKHPSVDNVSESSVTEDSMSVATSSSTPQIYMLIENSLEGKLPALACPRRAICPSCSSETSDTQGSEESDTLSKHNRGYECSMMSAVAVDIRAPVDCQRSHSVSNTYSCTTFKPATLSDHHPRGGVS